MDVDAEELDDESILTAWKKLQSDFGKLQSDGALLHLHAEQCPEFQTDRAMALARISPTFHTVRGNQGWLWWIDCKSEFSRTFVQLANAAGTAICRTKSVYSYSNAGKEELVTPRRRESSFIAEWLSLVLTEARSSGESFPTPRGHVVEQPAAVSLRLCEQKIYHLANPNSVHRSSFIDSLSRFQQSHNRAGLRRRGSSNPNTVAIDSFRLRRPEESLARMFPKMPPTAIIGIESVNVTVIAEELWRCWETTLYEVAARLSKFVTNEQTPWLTTTYWPNLAGCLKRTWMLLPFDCDLLNCSADERKALSDLNCLINDLWDEYRPNDSSNRSYPLALEDELRFGDMVAKFDQMRAGYNETSATAEQHQSITNESPQDVTKESTSKLQLGHNLRIRISPTRDGQRQLAAVQLFNAGPRPFYVSDSYATWGSNGHEIATFGLVCVKGSLPKRLEDQEAINLIVDISNHSIEELTALGVCDGENRPWPAERKMLQTFIQTALQHQSPLSQEPPVVTTQSPSGDQPRTRESLFLSEDPKHIEADLINGTNVLEGVEVVFRYRSSGDELDLSEHEATPGWEQYATRILSEFRDFRKVALPVGAILFDSRSPGLKLNDAPADHLKQGKSLVASSSVLLELSQILDATTFQPIAGLFPFLDRNGKPMTFPNGKPIAFKCSLIRFYEFVKVAQGVTDDRKLLTSRLIELCAEAGQLLLQLPTECLKALWHRWGMTRKLPDQGEYSWLDAVFEFEWSSPKTKLARGDVIRQVWRSDGYSSLVLKDCGLFPRAHLNTWGSSEEYFTHQFPTEAGYPFQWGSELNDVVGSSIRLLEFIISSRWDKQLPEKAEIKMSVASIDKQNPVSRGEDVFISYAHKDKAFLNQFLTHLRPFNRSGAINVWCDKDIAPGEKWFDEIKTAMSRAKVAVMLVSPHFLESDFIHHEELTPLLKAASERGVKILWVCIRACAFKETILKDYQAILPPEKPLAQMKANRDAAWVKVCEYIKSTAMPNAD